MKDSDFTEGNLEEFIELNQLDMRNVTDMWFPTWELREYDVNRRISMSGEFIVNRLAFDEFVVRVIEERETTKKEFQEFVESYFSSIGKKVIEQKNFDGYTTFITDDNWAYDIGQTKNIKKINNSFSKLCYGDIYSVFDGGYYIGIQPDIYFDPTIESAITLQRVLYYSKNKKFFIIFTERYQPEDLIKFVTNENG